METEHTDAASELRKGNFLIISTSGTSMRPLLYDKKKKCATQVLVMPVRERPKVGDLPLFARGDGKYVIHRIVGEETGENGGVKAYITRGDNCIGHERVPPAAILGMVEEIYRKGRTIKVTDKGYAAYVRVWDKLFPIRRVWYKARIFLHKIARKIRSG